ncbi:MAG: winged helix-turn-helix domain-containing protein [Rhodanobacteraceae bacterium]
MKALSPPLERDEPVRLSGERDFRLGDLDIHPSVSEATRGEHRQHVEPRVMQVLVALASAGGAVVSRDELIQRCWDGRVVGEAAINRCISRLRALADRGDGTRSFNVETIARVGYRLQAAAVAAQDSLSRVVATSVPHRNRIAALALAGLATVALAATAVSHYGASPRAAGTVADVTAAPSIAVLPFKNLSSDPDGAYFADAIQDEILTRLAKIGSLKVISRTSAVEAAKKPGTLADIGRTLGVANVLEGSVQRAGDRVRVNVQLIRAASDDHLWAEAYDRHLDDVLTVENDIAGSIATALAAKITPGETLALTTTPTRNAKAYDLYLHAVVLYGAFTDEATLKAIASLDRAVALDPDFALAWAMLVRVQANIYFGDRDPARRERIRYALDRAMALAPDLAEVQLAHAQYRHYVELDYAGAADELRTLQARWPNNIEVLQSLAFIARRVGQWQEAVEYLRRAQTLDPLSRINLGYIAETLQYAHRGDDLSAILEGMQAIWPDDKDLLICEARMLQGEGDLDRADAALNRVPAWVDASGETLATRRAQFAFRRRFDEGLAWFEALHASAPVQAWDPLQRATLDSAIGDFRRWSGDSAGARESYQAAAVELRETADAAHANSDALALSAIAYSGFGDRESALRYAKLLADAPLALDTINGAVSKESIARMLARLGDRDAAIAALERVAKEPGMMTIEQVRLDPDFDTLHGQPRFERLLADGMTRLE